MQLDGYDLVAMTVDNGNHVSKVRQQSSGRLFQVHAFHGSQIAEFERLCRELPQLSPQITRVVKVSRDDERGSGYIMTELLPEGVGVAEWIERLGATPPAAASNPELSHASVETLRKLETEPGALRPLLPGPERRKPAATPPVEPEPGESDLTRVYRLASAMRNRGNAAGAVAGGRQPGPAVSIPSSASHTPPAPPALPRPTNSHPPAPTQPSEDTHTDDPGDFTIVMQKAGGTRKTGPPPESRPDPTPQVAPIRSKAPPFIPPPTQQNSAPPKTEDEPGLNTWLMGMGGKPISKEPSAPHSEASMEPLPLPKHTPEPEMALPKPPPAKPQRQMEPNPNWLPSRVPVPQSLSSLPPPRKSKPPSPPPTSIRRIEEASTGWDLRMIGLTAAGLLVVVILILWLVEEFG